MCTVALVILGVQCTYANIHYIKTNTLSIKPFLGNASSYTPANRLQDITGIQLKHQNPFHKKTSQFTHTLTNNDIFSQINTPTRFYSQFKNNDVNSGFSSKEGLLDAQKNQKIAERILRKLNQRTVQIHDPWVHDSFGKLISNINAQARSDALIAHLILADKRINAFATPGGLIAVNSGLITQSNNVDELVSVLAHEVAHISQRHFDRRQENQATDMLINLGGLIASAAIAKNNPKAASAVAAGSQAYTLDKQLAFSRAQEKEADRIGMQIMQRAGFNTQAMPAFFAQLSKYNGTLGYVPEFVLTHPLTQNRMSEAQLRANQTQFVPSTQHTYAQKQFLLLKWQLKALADHANTAHIRHVANAPGEEQLAAQYALVRLYLRLGDAKNHRQAQQLLNSLPDAQREQSLFFQLQAQLWRDQNKLKKANKLLTQATKLYPQSRSLHLLYADVLRLLDQTQLGKQVLQPFIQKNKRDVVLWQALAKISASLPPSTINEVIALRYSAEARFWENDISNALESLARAKNLAKDMPSHKAKIQKRFDDMLAIHNK